MDHTKNYRALDDFQDDAEFRGYVKAKLEEFDRIIPIVQQLTEKTWTIWGIMIGVSAFTSFIISVIFNFVNNQPK